MPLPPEIDRDLWVEVEGYEGRCYLEGNAHTHPGRMHAWSDSLDRSVSISRYEIASASDASRRWIDGFMAGNEPTLKEFLGAPTWLEADETGDEYLEEWWAWLAEFRATGKMAPSWGRPELPLPEGAPVPELVWAMSGALSVVWDGRAWVIPTPRLEREHWFLPGSLCAERDGHELSPVGRSHWVCSDCGYCEEIVPDEGTEPPSS